MEESFFAKLASRLAGELHTGETIRRLFSTDASEYQEMPAGVVFPKNEADLREIIRFANEHRVSLIPRTAGTSLAGQVVGSGLVVDVSRHFTKILSVDRAARRLRQTSARLVNVAYWSSLGAPKAGAE